MTQLASIRTQLESLEKEMLPSGKPRFLFRGQSQIYSSVKSRFARIPACEKLRIGQAYTTCRYAKEIGKGLRGYSIGPLDGIAVLQHYGWPTPLIDLSAKLEVAIFFALLNAKPGQEAVIYKLDCKTMSNKAIIIDHFFLTHQLDDGGLKHRWIRQDGFAIAPADWRDSDSCRKFDLLKAPFSSSITPYRFTIDPSDCADIEDILSIEGDPIPKHLQNLLRIFCEDKWMFGDSLDKELRLNIELMYP